MRHSESFTVDNKLANRFDIYIKNSQNGPVLLSFYNETALLGAINSRRISALKWLPFICTAKLIIFHTRQLVVLVLSTFINIWGDFMIKMASLPSARSSENDCKYLQCKQTLLNKSPLEALRPFLDCQQKLESHSSCRNTNCYTIQCGFVVLVHLANENYWKRTAKLGMKIVANYFLVLYGILRA